MTIKTTSRQDKDFQDRLFEKVEDGIRDAIRNILAIDASWVLDWVQFNFSPSDVFNVEELKRWAEQNGYQQETK